FNAQVTFWKRLPGHSQSYCWRSACRPNSLSVVVEVSVNQPFRNRLTGRQPRHPLLHCFPAFRVMRKPPVKPDQPIPRRNKWELTAIFCQNFTGNDKVVMERLLSGAWHGK